MGCFVALERYVTRTVEYWAPRLEEAFQTAEAPTLLARLGLSAPVRGEAEWREWSVANLDVAQCRALALQARQETKWEEIKTAALTVGGVFISAVLYSLMIVVAGAVFVAGMELTVFTADYLEIAVNFFAAMIGFLIGEIGSMAITTKVAIPMFNFAPRIWTKELFPAITRAQNHAQHLRDSAARLEARAVTLEGIGMLNLSAEQMAALIANENDPSYASLFNLVAENAEGDEGDEINLQNLGE